MTRQEKRGMADMRHLERDKRLRKILAAKATVPQTTKAESTSALVTSIGPGVCTVLQAGETSLVRCDLPVAPGDEVVIRHQKVAGIGPRRTKLTRTDPSNHLRQKVIAANIDLLVIVAAIEDPPFRPGLVDRYVIAARRGGIQPLLCINKVDLAPPALVTEALGPFTIPSVRCSTRTGDGLEDLRALLAGNLSVFAGHSGVGKSSLLNALAGSSIRTGEVSEGSGKGKHTTTSSSLINLGNGARVIDTPGIREFGLGRLTLSELRAAFPEFEAERCRFTDCTHRTEPGCGVRDNHHPRHAAWLRIFIEL